VVIQPKKHLDFFPYLWHNDPVAEIAQVVEQLIRKALQIKNLSLSFNSLFL